MFFKSEIISHGSSFKMYWIFLVKILSVLIVVFIFVCVWDYEQNIFFFVYSGVGAA